MLDLKQAAKYLVVAWVKDWPMRMLLDVLDGRADDRVDDGRLVDLVQALPFMPTDAHWYLANRNGVSARHFIADAYPKLSSALWRTGDNSRRLGFASQIERLVAGGVKASSRMAAGDIAEMAGARRAMRQSTTSYRAARDAFRTNQRSAWNTCKA